MSRNDFSICTPSEFNAIAEAWNNNQEQLMHSDWERTRFLACYILQPHLKTKTTPKQLISFPWEKDNETVDNTPKKTKEEQQADFEKYKNLWQ